MIHSQFRKSSVRGHGKLHPRAILLKKSLILSPGTEGVLPVLVEDLDLEVLKTKHTAKEYRQGAKMTFYI